jgi:RHS repeat-associated protein
VAPLAVDPAALTSAGVSLGAVGDGLTTSMATLTTGFDANTGQDAAGVMFGRQYVNTGRDLLKAATAGINALRNIGYGVQVSAANYSRAEAASDISKRSQPLPSPPCPAPASPPSPPVPTGGGVAEPMLWGFVEAFVGDFWPNGDPGAMRTAAASWQSFATALYHVSTDTSGAYNGISAQQMPEAELIKKPIRDIGTMMSSVAGTCQTVATELSSFADQVEQTQQSIRDLLDKLGSIGGLVGTLFEFAKGHGEDELHEIADDIKAVLSNMKNQADAKLAMLETAKANVDTWALSLEKFADQKFVDFFGEDIGRVLAGGFNNVVDANEGSFRWAVSNIEGLSAMNPMRFAYDPQGAMDTWKGIGEFAALLNPSMIPATVANDPEGVKNILKGLARTDEHSVDRPMLGATQSLLDVATLVIPGVGEAGAGADAASAASRAARVSEVAEDASGIARTTSRLSEAAKVTGALGDATKQTAGITGKLEEIAGKPVSLEPPAGGRPVTPTAPVEPPAGPVAKQPAPESTAPRGEVPSERPSGTTSAPAEAPAPVERAPVGEPPSPPAEAPPPSGGVPSEVAPPSGGSPAPAPHELPAEAPHGTPAEAPNSPEHTPSEAPGEHPGSGEHQPGDGDPADPHHGDGEHHEPGDSDGGGPTDQPEHQPNHQVEHDGQQPGAATEQQHQPITNEPVDVATGEYLLPALDVHLPGTLPLRLTRQHRSQYRQGLWFGPTWSSSLDSRAVITESAVTTIDADGTLLLFDHPVRGMPAVARHGQRWTLHIEPSGSYRLDDPRSERSTYFAPLPGADTGVLPVSMIVDRHGNRIVFAYNEFGVPVRVEHSGGPAVDVDCRNGRVREYRVDGVPVRRFGYADGVVTSVTNGVGAVTRFDYDDAHRMVSWTDSSGARYSNNYDSRGRVVSQTGAEGVWAGTFDYFEGRTTFTDALGNATEYRFDGELRPVAVTDPSGHTSRTAFATAHDPLSISDAAGATTSYRYDRDGRLTQLTDPLGHVLALTYTDGKPTQLLGPDGALTRYEYDARGNLTTVHDPAGGMHRWEYDERGAVTAHVDPVGRRTTVDNSEFGLPQRIVDAVGNETHFDYDAFGRPVTVTAADGAVTSMAYDAEGHLVSRVAVDGGHELWEFDGEGNCVAFTNAGGATTRWEYGYYDLVTARIDADGGRTTYGYNVARQLISVTNPAGLMWHYAYRPNGLLEFETDFNGAITRYDYDTAGRLAMRTNAVGQSVQYRYDAAGNLVSETSGAAGDFGSERVTYDYDAAGRRIAASNTEGRLDLVRDPAGRVVTESWNGRAVVSRYSAAGDLLEVRTPSGLPAALTYDERGVAEALTVAGRPCEVNTDALGRATTYRYGTSEVSSTWDTLGRLTTRSVGVSAGDILASAGYQYRGDGELSDVRPGTGGSALGTIARYEADAVGRLTSQTLVDGTREEFRFDGSDNVQLGGKRWEYRGVLLTDDGRSRYSYDRAGRLTTVSTRRLGRKPDVWHYRWDAWDRLRELVTPDGTTFRYTYDPLGRRVAKESSAGMRVDFSWSGTRMVEQVSSDPKSGVTSWAYLPGELTPQIQVSQGEVDREFFALVTDQVGAPVAVLDPRTGSVAGQSAVSAWGSATWTGESTPWRFPGQYFDEESGLHYNFHRYYLPGAGRYISPDPLGLAPAPNPYGYPTNPTGWVDPLGLNPCQGGPPDDGSFFKPLGEGRYETPGGLEYGPGSVQGHRIGHVLAHVFPDALKPMHSIFSDWSRVFETIDEGWLRGGVESQPGKFNIDMGRIIGMDGERHLFIVVRPGTNRIVTAFPIHG